VTTTPARDRYTTLPDEKTLAEAVVALEELGFGVDVVPQLAPRRSTQVTVAVHTTLSSQRFPSSRARIQACNSSQKEVRR
jgi:hypothetical protein